MALQTYLDKRLYIHRLHEINFLDYYGRSSKIDFRKVKFIQEERVIWYRPLAVHTWFVEHILGGADIYGEFIVEVEDLQLLRNHCERVLESLVDERYCPEGGVFEYVDIAEELIPVKDKKYGLEYFYEIKFTLESLVDVLNEPCHNLYDFIYGSHDL